MSRIDTTSRFITSAAIGVTFLIVSFHLLEAQAESTKTSVPFDAAETLVIKEFKHYKEVSARTFQDNRKQMMDTDSFLTVGINTDQSVIPQFPDQPFRVCITAKGPLKNNPLPAITADSPAELIIQNGTITGMDLKLDPQTLSLSDGDEILIEAAIIPGGTTSCEDVSKARPGAIPEVRIVRTYVQFADFGLIHRESDAIAFVRSSQSSAWDARPGASVLFGWNKRTNHIPGRFWNFASPMMGVNVSLLDYDRNQTIEFGVGPVLSFIQGGLMFGTGWNLSTGFTKRRYVFVAVSFVNIASFIKKNVQSDQR